jgi:hypothetical protein
MSFNRLSYDSCSYKQELVENVSQLSYLLDPVKFEHCQKCRHELGLVGGTNVGVPNGNMVDLENELFGINRPNTHCPAYKFTPRSDGILQGKEYIKPVEHPTVDSSMRQLRPCQMISYHEVPQPPPVNVFSCGAGPRG